ncbi:MAG TPA: protein-L-isoaspartate O-methyltransferase [Burkholderiales bacterium]|jgi:protein-L-isoaspartate(D-aspartate) O-methyltransferase|nr:protein-L-isoaspartate O-methyltransferase [Burkholderiales bacterium]
MDVERARMNMIESQIRTWEVLDQTVLDLLWEIKREEFVPPQYRALAFADMEIPLGHGEVMLAPRLEARMLQELALTKADKVLEVGTGSGYVTALLSRLAGQVVSVERIGEFSHAAARKLAGHGIENVTLEIGDAADGWPRQAPYDAILLTGSVPVLPEAFKEELAPGGRLLAVIGQEPVMTATLITRVSDKAYESVGLFETCIPPLRNVKQPERFVF